MLGRRHFMGLRFFGLGVAGPLSAKRSRTVEPLLVTHTFLKALPGRRDQLARFIELSWLSMDRRGIRAGIVTHATLFSVAGVSDGPAVGLADFVMVVGYLTAGGYPDVPDHFFRDSKAA